MSAITRVLCGVQDFIEEEEEDGENEESGSSGSDSDSLTLSPFHMQARRPPVFMSPLPRLCRAMAA
jgi:hypothetical protein